MIHHRDSVIHWYCVKRDPPTSNTVVDMMKRSKTTSDKALPHGKSNGQIMIAQKGPHATIVQVLGKNATIVQVTGQNATIMQVFDQIRHVLADH